jgi:uncharacterized iron-regulated membrane protein
MAMTQRAIKGWYLVHKWTSLICTLFLLMLCITGLPLIFHDEIDAALGGPVALAEAPPGAKPDLDRIVAQVRKDNPGKIVTYMSWDLDAPVMLVATAPSFAADEDQTRTQAFDARTGAGRAGPPADWKI